MEILEIVKIEQVDFKGMVFNIEVEDDHSYTANDVIVANCRGIDVPVRLDKDGKSIKKREGIKGRRRRDDSFQRWFDKLPKKEQKRVLGKTKYELYKNGELNLKELVKGNRVMTLDEIARQKAISEIKSQLNSVENVSKLVNGLKNELDVKSLAGMTTQADINSYSKYLSAKAEIYRNIPNDVLKEAGINRKTLNAEIKQERALLDAKSKELKLKQATIEYELARNKAKGGKL